MFEACVGKDEMVEKMIVELWTEAFEPVAETGGYISGVDDFVVSVPSAHNFEIFR